MLKYFFRVFIFSLVGAPFLFQNVFGQELMSLEQCVYYALKSHKSIKSSQLKQMQQQELVKQLQSSWLPQLSARASYEFKADRAAQFSTARNKRFIFAHQLSPSLEVTQHVYDPTLSGSIALAQLRESISTYQVRRSEQDVIVAVKKAYYAWGVSAEQLTLIDANLKRLEKSLRDTQLKYDNGLAQKVDVNRIRVSLNNEKTQRSTLQREMALQIQMLQLHMGMPLDESLNIKKQDITTSLKALSLKDTDTTAYSHTIAYQIAQKQIDLAVLQQQNVKRSVWPKVSLTGSYRHTFAAPKLWEIFDEPLRISATLGASVSIPIYQGGKLRHQQREALYEQQIQQEASDLLVNKTRFEQRQARTNYQNSLDMLNNQRENRKLAQQNYDNIKYQYNNGVRPSLEVITAETALKEADNAYVKALYQAFTNLVDYQNSMGDIKPEDYMENP